MSQHNDEYLVELIGELANSRGTALRGGAEVETRQVRVRGKIRKVIVMSKFEVEALKASSDHKDHIRIYVEDDEGAVHLCYPTQKLKLPGDYQSHRNRDTQQAIVDAVTQASEIRTNFTKPK
jgi:hypothetical protein